MVARIFVGRIWALFACAGLRGSTTAHFNHGSVYGAVWFDWTRVGAGLASSHLFSIRLVRFFGAIRDTFATDHISSAIDCLPNCGSHFAFPFD